MEPTRGIKNSIALALILPLAIDAQTQSFQNKTLKASEAIGFISQQLRFKDAEGKKQYEVVRGRLTAQAFRAIDDYLETAVDPTGTSAADVSGALTDILHQSVESEYTGRPFAHLESLRFGKSLIVAFALGRGGEAVNDSAVSIRAYAWNQGTLKLTDSTSSDLNGYGLFTKCLSPSPAGETWLLAWVRCTGLTEIRLEFEFSHSTGQESEPCGYQTTC